MKVLWLVNTVIPDIGKKIGLTIVRYESWLLSFANLLQANSKYELTIVCPQSKDRGMICGKTDKLNFICYYEPPQPLRKVKKELVNCMNDVLNKVQPDIVHIWGTEFIHTYAMATVAKPERTVISIQGLISSCSRFYEVGLPFFVCNMYTFRDLFRCNNIRQQKRAFGKRGKYEEAVLKKAAYVIGRIDWDKAHINSINNKICYYQCNEILRESFYHFSWSYSGCNKHSIFMSQGDYPIKGLHFMLEALADILNEFPDVHLRVAGKNLMEVKSIKKGSYDTYITNMIHKKGLVEHVSFLGYLSEEQMCEEYLKANVYVLSSVIENSPNSLGEAMLLGVPCVASDVGGVKSMMTHEKEGFIYQHNDPIMLSYYIKNIFRIKEEIEQCSKQAHIHAESIFNVENNFEQLCFIYDDICKLNSIV